MQAMIKKILLIAALLPALAPARQVPDPVQVVEVVAARDAEWGGYRHPYKAAATSPDYAPQSPLHQVQMPILPP